VDGESGESPLSASLSSENLHRYGAADYCQSVSQFFKSLGVTTFFELQREQWSDFLARALLKESAQVPPLGTLFRHGEV
jgi:hypothetical protein